MKLIPPRSWFFPAEMDKAGDNISVLHRCSKNYTVYIRLKHLTVKGRHALLEILWLTSGLEFPSVPSHLQSVTFYPTNASTPFQILQSLNTAHNLTHMSLFHYGRTSQLEQAGEFSSLTTCLLPPISSDRISQHLEYLAKFAKLASNVEQLAIGAPRTSRHGTITSVIQTLLSLTKLKVILQLFSSLNISKPTDMQTLQCAYDHPSLSCVDIEVNNRQRCIRSLRSESSDQPAFEVIPLTDLNPVDWRSKWDGFFRGFA